MAPSLKVAILAGSTSWIDAKPNKHPYDPQAAIGWEAFHYGFLAADWQHAQAEYYRTRKMQTIEESSDDESTTIAINIDEEKPKKRKIIKTGPVWSAKLIEFLWLNLKSAWKERCDHLHDRDGKIAKQRRREEIQKKITSLYDLKPLLSAADRPLLDSKSLYYRINQKTYQMEHWYESNVRVIHYCVQKQQERIKQGNKDIRNFFTRIEQQDTDDISETTTVHAPLDNISISNQSLHDEPIHHPTDKNHPISTARTATFQHRGKISSHHSPHTLTTGNPTPRYHSDSDSNTTSDSDNSDDDQSTITSPPRSRQCHQPNKQSNTETNKSTSSQSDDQSHSDSSLPSIDSESSYQPSESTCPAPAKKPSTASKLASTLVRNLRISPSSTRKNTSKTTSTNSSSSHSSLKTQDPCSTRTPPLSTSKQQTKRSSMKHYKNRPQRNQNDAAPAAKRQRLNQPTPQARPAKQKWDRLPAMNHDDRQRQATKKRCLQTIVAHRKQRKTNDISIFDLFFNDQSNI
jgi:hypothetical protein